MPAGQSCLYYAREYPKYYLLDGPFGSGQSTDAQIGVNGTSIDSYIDLREGPGKSLARCMG